MDIRPFTVGDTVKDRPTDVVLEGDTVAQAARHITEHRIGALPVLSEGYEPGIFVDQMGIFSWPDRMRRWWQKKSNQLNQTSVT